MKKGFRMKRLMFIVMLTGIVNGCHGMDKNEYRAKKLKLKKVKFCLQYINTAKSLRYHMMLIFRAIPDGVLPDNDRESLTFNNERKCAKLLKKYMAEYIED